MAPFEKHLQGDEPPTTLDDQLVWTRFEESDKFHMGIGQVHETLRHLSADLGREGIDYAVVGGMALNAHGYKRETVDVDVLVRPEGLQQFAEKCVGRGYVPAFAGARTTFKDTRTGVKVEFLTTGEFPGDGKPKPVAFPDPSSVAVESEGLSVINLPTLIELKLASGMTHPGRLRDLADVQELVRTLALKREYAERLNPYVRGKFLELLAGLEP
jgi:hypothetical protein